MARRPGPIRLLKGGLLAMLIPLIGLGAFLAGGAGIYWGVRAGEWRVVAGSVFPFVCGAAILAAIVYFVRNPTMPSGATPAGTDATPAEPSSFRAIAGYAGIGAFMLFAAVGMYFFLDLTMDPAREDIRYIGPAFLVVLGVAFFGMAGWTAVFGDPNDTRRRKR